MRRKNFIYLLIAMLTAVLPASMEAQGLGNILNKGKKALEKVTAKETPKVESAVAAADAVNLENGIEVVNPISEFIEVEPVGLYGVSKSENFGDAYLVLKVLLKIPKESACFGSSIKNQKMIAVDGKGKIYNIDASGCTRYDLIEGIPVVVKMDDPQMMLQDIRKDITMLPVVKFGINIDASHQDNLTLRNVPIFWDQNPEGDEE